ncbi:uncharacterized protein CXorf58 homolog isoform X2 [Alosa alosa]|uniref:uncharacterized protein CXorf58 homolog isoform X2 n=1 Tax=Alosa alosa TaxID=278164 RepID=UPI0020153DBB|nr:uncharacterized protein CXorf58 homolog isoform X2 [Alosa alosa]
MDSNVSFDLQQTVRAAMKIQKFWRSYQDRTLFHLLLQTVRKALSNPEWPSRVPQESSLTPAVLRQLNPREAQLLRDPSMHCKVRFRFCGSQFPPIIVFKIFQSGGRQHYISGKKIFRPYNQATPQTCKIMGNRKFLDLLVTDELLHLGQRVADAADVVCMRDFMQYSSHLDELPAYLGGRSNSWRTLRLHPLPGPTLNYAHLPLGRTGPAGAHLRPDLLQGVLQGCHAAGETETPGGGARTLRSPAARPSSFASVPSSERNHSHRQTPSSSRASSVPSSSRRSGKFHRAISMKMRQLYISGHHNKAHQLSPDSPLRVRPTDTVPEGKEEGFNRSPSPFSNNSDWEKEQEEADRLCDWSRNLGEFEDDIEPMI